MPSVDDATQGGTPLVFAIEKRWSPALRSTAQIAVLLAFLAAFVYSVARAWAVLGELDHVKLVELRRALEVISVRDAIVCFLGYRLGWELLRAAIRPKRKD